MRKHFLIKPRLQLLHLTWVLAAVILATLSGYILLETVAGNAVSQGLVASGEWLELRSSLRTGFALVMIILVIVIGLENYLFFHRVVGPLYALEKGLKRLSRGHFGDVMRIRESDELAELIQSFEEVKKQLQLRMEIQEKTAFLLTKELDCVLTEPTPENIRALQNKIREIREHVVKEAA